MAIRPARPQPRPLSALGSLLGVRLASVGKSLSSNDLGYVSGVTLDSRAVAPGDLYVALPGTKVHGAAFCADAVAAGAAAVLTDPDGRARAAQRRGMQSLRKAEETMRETQAALAHVTRVMTMGELAASIAHEVNQPLAGVVINGNACLRWLAGESPNLAEAREAAQRIIRDGTRASEIIARIRALAQKTSSLTERVDLNDAIREVVALCQGEARKHIVELRTQLPDDLPPVRGDRVLIQQVVLNLVINGIEAMRDVRNHPRELVIRAWREADQVRASVRDSGVGLDPEARGRIFDALYTTKPGGLGNRRT